MALVRLPAATLRSSLSVASRLSPPVAADTACVRPLRRGSFRPARGSQSSHRRFPRAAGEMSSTVADSAPLPPAAPLKMVLVSAVALIDDRGRILLAQRPEGKAMAGLWEFPGGKVEANESPEAALVRELREELAVSVDPAQLQPITFASHTYEKFHLLMPVRMRLCT
eukprot:CAMPEP_0177764628 /NCGR_PEP_ID=MMETSP0491_2-20121128/7508_1 /TAXON_ID=63592 /ORGANISM="Tetraselmis chuii, Strain PLY429" /LENGTH=167 /DNA_ID=CAMNT_0019280819 /DNA_START=74 /DNA_END=577 /DNA_ORIENTATION=-